MKLPLFRRENAAVSTVYTAIDMSTITKIQSPARSSVNGGLQTRSRHLLWPCGRQVIVLQNTRLLAGEDTPWAHNKHLQVSNRVKVFYQTEGKNIGWLEHRMYMRLWIEYLQETKTKISQYSSHSPVHRQLPHGSGGCRAAAIDAIPPISAVVFPTAVLSQEPNHVESL